MSGRFGCGQARFNAQERAFGAVPSLGQHTSTIQAEFRQ